MNDPNNAKKRFLAACLVLAIFYIGFSFALNAHADPPGSPYAPGATLNPNCSPTSTNCTVQPPLFSTTTLPQGGILFVSDASGTITANTSTLYWNAGAGEFQIGQNPAQSGTSTLLSLGMNSLATTTANASGTWLGINQNTSTGALFLLFQTNSSTEFQVSSSGGVLAAGAFNASGTITQNGVAVLTAAPGTTTINGVVGPTFTFATSSGSPLNITTTTGQLTFSWTNPGFVASASSVTWTGAQTFSATTTFNSSTILGSLAGATGCLSVTSSGLIATSTCSALASSSPWTTNFLPLITGGNTLGQSLISQSAGGSMIQFASGTRPFSSTSTAFLTIGSGTIQNGNVSGTWIGINVPSAFNGDFLNFQVNSSSYFDVGSTTITIAPPATSTQTFAVQDNGGNNVLAVDTSQSSTNSGIDITAAGAQVSNLLNFYSSSSVLLAGFDANGNLFFGSTTILGNSDITFGSLPFQSTTSTVMLFGSAPIAGGSASGTLIGVNFTGFNGDFMNLQSNGATMLRIASSGILTVGTGTTAFSDTLFAIATATRIFSVENNGDINLGPVLPPVAPTLSTSTGGSFAAATYFVKITALDPSGAETTPGAETSIVIAANNIITASWPQAYGAASYRVYVGTSTNAEGRFMATALNSIVISTSSLSAAAPPSTNNAVANHFGFSSGGLNYVGGGAGGVTSSLMITGLVNASNTKPLLILGTTALTSPSANGTYVGLNATASYAGDYINFQLNALPKFMVDASGSIEIATGTPATGNSLLTIATTSAIFSISNNGLISLMQGGGLAIGTTTMPGATSTLAVCAKSNCTLPSSTNAVAYFASTSGGTTAVSIMAKGTITGGLADIGEYIPVAGSDAVYSQGDVVSVMPAPTVTFEKSTVPYDDRLAGVITTTAGFVAGGGDDSHGSTVIALAGRIPVNVTTANGAIHVGDVLTSSEMPGIAMRATQPGRVIGIALQDDFGDIQHPNATSQVMMLVNLGWSLGNLTSIADIASSSWTLAGASAGSGIVDQFTAYVEAALAKLGLTIANGIATVQQLVSQKVVTNELCVGTTCINQSQLAQMLGSQGDGSTSGSGGTDASGGSGSSSSSDPNAPQPPANITIGGALGIAFSSPSDGSVVSGTMQLDVNLTLVSSTTIARVDYQLDGNTLGQGLWTNNPEYSYSWDTTIMATGTHMLSATVTDSTGATSTAKVEVMVPNST